MTPILLSPPVAEFPYLRGDLVKNCLVNITLVTKIRASDYAWYPDNRGCPAIDFYFIGDSEKPGAKWVFPPKTKRMAVQKDYRTHVIEDVLDTSERDVELARLLDLFKLGDNHGKC